MDGALPSPPEPDSASDRGLIVMEVLCELVLHCRLACAALTDEVDMDLDELILALEAAQAEARRTYMAADLLNRGAELSEKWGHKPPRPKAVFARHSAAVRAGAVKMIPRPSPADELFDALSTFDPLDRISNIPPSERPHCAASRQDGSQACCGTAVYIGGGKWAPNCYVHSTAVERGLFRKHSMEVSATRSRQYEYLATTLQEVGCEIIQRWFADGDPVDTPADLTGQDSAG